MYDEKAFLDIGLFDLLLVGFDVDSRVSVYVVALVASPVFRLLVSSCGRWRLFGCCGCVGSAGLLGVVAPHPRSPLTFPCGRARSVGPHCSVFSLFGSSLLPASSLTTPSKASLGHKSPGFAVRFAAGFPPLRTPPSLAIQVKDGAIITLRGGNQL